MVQRLTHWSFVAFLCLAGLFSVLLGGFLIYLGGSWYYFLSGAAVIAIAVALIRRNPKAVRIYGVLLALTLVWAIYESGLYFLALLPRLAMWMVLGNVVPHTLVSSTAQ